MKKIWKIILIIIGIALFIFLFGWFQIRPAEIKKSCANRFKVYSGENFNNRYSKCIKENGL